MSNNLTQVVNFSTLVPDFYSQSCSFGFRGSHPEVFCRKGVPRNFATFTGKYLCQSLFLNKVAGLQCCPCIETNQLTGFYMRATLKACNFIKKETLVQVSSGEFCEISKNTFFYRTPPVAASVDSNLVFDCRPGFAAVLPWLRNSHHVVVSVSLSDRKLPSPSSGQYFAGHNDRQSHFC